MINLDLDRDGKGKYVLEKAFSSNDFYVEGAPALSDIKKYNYYNFWLHDKKGDGYFIKGYKDCHTIFWMTSEALYSKLCQNNGVPCAEIDFGTFDDQWAGCTISKDVRKDKFNCEYLCFGDILKLVLSIEVEDASFSVKTIMKILNKFCKKHNLILDKNTEYQLKCMALLDYLQNQVDRNVTNFIFEIAPEGTMSLCPLFDNELAYNFNYLTEDFEDLVEYMGEFEIIYEEPISRDLEEIMVSAIDACDDQKVLVHLCSEDMNALSNKKIKLENKNGEMFLLPTDEKVEDIDDFIAEGFAKEIIKDKKFARFYNGLRVNFKKFAEEIKNQTGFKIPNLCIEMADNIYAKRRLELDKKLAQFEEEMGDD